MELLSTNSDTYTSQTQIFSDPANINHEVTENYVHIPDRDVPPRAIAVLPPVLQVRRDCISPRRSLPSRVRFGPVKGVAKAISCSEVKEMAQKSVEHKTPLFLLNDDQNSITHIDHTDHDKANWLGLLPLGDHTTANVWLYQQGNKLYALTTKSIPPRTPLMLGYSTEYVKMHGFPSETPSIDLHDALASPSHEWWCYECQRALPSAVLLQNHIDIEHKDEKVIPRRRNRCQRCKRTFARLFTLKRHMVRYCTNKTDKQPDTAQDNEKSCQNVELETNSFLDESRATSEEILHNFTSSIDFNSIFDTYRSLETGGSKSADLLDPENQLSKNDNGLTSIAEFNFANISTNIDDNLCQSTSVVYKKPVPSSNKNVSTRRKRAKPQRLKQCKTVENSDIMYKCEDCQLIFKRRGMFVNHLWRVHQNVTTSIPLERRVRSYPCAGCSKVYRTAAKRDRHVRNHHPGVAAARAIESGRRACEAAACTACPRQYATRAKLLQHIRAAHPHIAPPLKRLATAQSHMRKLQHL